MKKAWVVSFVATAAGLAALPASAADILARVISSTPAVQQVAVPRQVCNYQPMVVQSPSSGAGALLGAVAGGAAGNAIGNGSGRAAATLIGLVGGAIIGDQIEGSNSQVQNVQQCTTQTYYENRPTHYNVVYEYQDRQYTAQMASDPGPYIRLQISPVGAVTPSAWVEPSQAYESQPAYVEPSTTYVQPAAVAAPVYPAYYQRPYYAAPYYPPIGFSLSLGHSWRHGGHRHHRHHRR